MIEFTLALRPTNRNPHRKVVVKDLDQLVELLKEVRMQGDPEGEPSQMYKCANVELDQVSVCLHLLCGSPTPAFPYHLIGGIYDTELGGWHYKPSNLQDKNYGHLSQALYNAFVKTHGGETRKARPEKLL